MKEQRRKKKQRKKTTIKKRENKGTKTKEGKVNFFFYLFNFFSIFISYFIIIQLHIQETRAFNSYELQGSKNSFYFDFVADTGDGWNSTFTVATLLAQPFLEVFDPYESNEEHLINNILTCIYIQGNIFDF